MTNSTARKVPDNLSGEENAVYGLLADGTLMKPDALAEGTELLVHEVMATLTLLELKRLVSRRPDGSFEVR